MVGVVDVDARGPAGGARGRRDPLAGRDDPRVVGGGAREAERAREVGRAEEQDVDAVDRRDRLDGVERAVSIWIMSTRVSSARGTYVASRPYAAARTPGAAPRVAA